MSKKSSSSRVRGGAQTLATTHLVIVVLLGMLLQLDKNEWAAAITFGIIVDADHLFAMPRYVSENGWSAVFAATWDDGSGQPWRSLFHYPIGAGIVGPLAEGWRFLTPLLFWGLHVSADHLQMWTIEYSAVVEGAVFSGACVGIIALSYGRWRSLQGDSSFSAYTRQALRGLASRLSPH